MDKSPTEGPLGALLLFLLFDTAPYRQEAQYRHKNGIFADAVHSTGPANPAPAPIRTQSASTGIDARLRAV
jgi:hypothetical protein